MVTAVRSIHNCSIDLRKEMEKTVLRIRMKKKMEPLTKIFRGTKIGFKRSIKDTKHKSKVVKGETA